MSKNPDTLIDPSNPKDLADIKDRNDESNILPHRDFFTVFEKTLGREKRKGTKTEGLVLDWDGNIWRRRSKTARFKKWLRGVEWKYFYEVFVVNDGYQGRTEPGRFEDKTTV